MRVVIFCHSLVSDWNHGNAHFLRGIASEILALGHQLCIYEPHDAWSVQNLLKDHGRSALERFRSAYPELRSTRYHENRLDLTRALAGAHLVLVHEWNSPELVRRIGEHHATHPQYTLFFHDTHHRAVTAPDEMRRYDLAHYDGVLAFGEVIRRIYLHNGWTRCAYSWHEAADTRKFSPVEEPLKRADLVWIGNFGDDERTAELNEFLIEPVRRLGLRATVYGVRYPEGAVSDLGRAGIDYGGYLPNWEVPRAFAEHRLTVHIPRRPYAAQLPGIPTIRPFEAMASGIPLVSAPWSDTERLFRPGLDYWVAEDGSAMTRAIRRLLDQPGVARELARRARSAILQRHTCAHRVQQLFDIRRAVLAERSCSPAESSKLASHRRESRATRIESGDDTTQRAQ